MKGIVFREFMEMVEATFGDETVDMMVEQNDLCQRWRLHGCGNLRSPRTRGHGYHPLERDRPTG